MIRRIMHFFAALFEWLSLQLDGRAPTLHRVRAVRAVQVVHVHQPYRKSRDRAMMSHHCNIPPWHLTNGGSFYCPICRTTRTYAPLPLPRQEATAPHFVPRVRGRHNGHLVHTGGLVVDTGKLFVPGR